jgi:hypothetical protein
MLDEGQLMQLNVKISVVLLSFLGGVHRFSAILANQFQSTRRIALPQAVG